MIVSEPKKTLPLRIDIVSDVVCPWCIIGYKQLCLALDELSGRFETEVHWQPFELNPAMPEEGQDLREHLAQKYGAPPEQGGAVRARLTQLGESLGFHFDYYGGMRIYNTFRAHQLLHWAGLLGKQTSLKLALFESFFSLRENVSDPATLCEVAARAGLDSLQARQVLDSERYAATVREEQARWLERDVHAVPMFFFNGGYGVPGAQEPRTFVRLLDKLRERELAVAG